MNDRTMSVGCTVAYTLWTLAVMLLSSSWLVFSEDLADHLAQTALFFAGAAITATIRVYFVNQNRIIRSVLAVRDSVDEPIRAVR